MSTFTLTLLVFRLNRQHYEEFILTDTPQKARQFGLLTKVVLNRSECQADFLQKKGRKPHAKPETYKRKRKKPSPQSRLLRVKQRMKNGPNFCKMVCPLCLTKQTP